MRTCLICLRGMLLLLGIVVLATACLPFVGDDSEEEEPTPIVIPTVIRPTPVTSDPPTASPVPTLVPVATQPPQATSAPPSCTPRTDWPIYTIQSGDTLYSIALRSDSTVDTLQAANCLTDPNVIREGQELRVPKIPPPPTPAPAAAPVATPSTFFTTPAPVGDVTFTIVIAQTSASVVAERTYRAQTPDGVVYLSIVTGNATSYRVVRSDGYELAPVVLAAAGQSAGNTIPFKRLDRPAGSDSLIFTIKAVKSDGTTVESQPIFIQWP